ncbi:MULTISPECIES: poly-gamma-glutamate hydrolase family protein [unclassified Mesorhizobium]|uniref:poly-gamma-glutamate hydrolase family protein n=1 Tax=unclassified Mesorhizobium TaxID=325217 RepID=UPI000BAEEA42|nr:MULTISPECIES: poly-gamma-glutamate hydrolase family protein [unclassified Mesorhizobium]TGT57602.1 replication protein [Mesorhizobium sp. M00.F.Ca.ET.170.01.1.1]AZO09600.1 replication protein [Mesorhizobium sp. M3A.F.Ca.ET.080.04.2.1]PBB83929.1 replication protein [Mesorhizobium sp. WSM3876]RWB68617.1 MAG: replication protein [Mesorhizobium sp.]RWB90865.1 MAG: replication protein [Mesorhizobium sp.]
MEQEFPNFAALKIAKTENIDYRIVVRRGARSGSAIVIAPHGGKIEPRTSLITQTIAGSDLDLYCFEGLMPESNRELHITSRNFDEETALELLRTKSTVVSIHGRHDRDDPSTVYMGGKDAALISAIVWRLQEAGFSTQRDNHPFPGIDDFNIVNRGLTGKGAQLEIPFTLRQRLANEPELLDRFCTATRKAIQAFDAENGVQPPIVS